MQGSKKILVVLGTVLVLAGCSSAEKADRPDALLEEQVKAWEKYKDHDWEAVRALGKRTEVPDEDLLRHRFEELAEMFPRHVPTLVANGVVAYDAHLPERAQEYLDRALALAPVHPEAAVLRARIASEQGDLPFAKRLLDDQIRFTPDHAGLREADASVLFELGRLDEARAELDAAQRLGAPAWRVAFNAGLIEETAGRPGLAMKYYETALHGNEKCNAARSRLRALEAAPPRDASVAEPPGDR